MGLFFDRRFVGLLRIGDIEGAIALLTKKYPHLKNDEDRQRLYINKYSNAYVDNTTTKPVR